MRIDPKSIAIHYGGMALYIPRPRTCPIIQRAFTFSKAFSVLALCLLTAGCTLVEKKKVEPRPARSRPLATTPSKVEVANPQANPEPVQSPDQANASVDDVEVIWALPTEPVEGFVLRYGTDEGNLDREARLMFGEVEQVADRTHGMVLRHVLKAMPRDVPIFISIAAFSMDKESPPSAILTVPPAR